MLCFFRCQEKRKGWRGGKKKREISGKASRWQCQMEAKVEERGSDARSRRVLKSFKSEKKKESG